MFPQDKYNDFFPSLDNQGSGGGIPEAPIDGNQYGRKNANWSIVTGSGWTLQKKITITGFIASATTITVNANGANHTVSGDVINLGASALLFNANLLMRVMLNGIDLEKGVEVVWVSSSSFYLSLNIDTPDKIIILA